MAQLVFDEEAAARIEELYVIGDAVRRRAIVRGMLAAQPGERILDVGCGPGFYCLELLDEVGASGSVVGVDSSPAMLELARRRCAGQANVELVPGEAVDLPLEDDSVDAAVCVQVLEYVEDATAGLAELHRVVTPGGRIVVWDIDWETLSVHTEDAARSERVLRAWDEHLAHRSLPRTLAPRLRSAGFDEISMESFVLATRDWDADRYGVALVPFIGAFVDGRDGVGPGEAEAWVAEQRSLGERGAFFFACTQFCFTARKPG